MRFTSSRIPPDEKGSVATMLTWSMPTSNRYLEWKATKPGSQSTVSFGITVTRTIICFVARGGGQYESVRTRQSITDIHSSRNCCEAVVWRLFLVFRADLLLFSAGTI